MYTGCIYLQIVSSYFFEKCTLLAVEYFRLVSLLKARTVCGTNEIKAPEALLMQ